MSASHSTRTKLTDLPQGLQSHIFSFLLDRQRIPPIIISLDSAETVIAPLPHSLLAVAHASPSLATVVADLLARRAEYLTASNAKKDFSHWITLLARSVKAVSTYDPLLEWQQSNATPAYPCLDRLYEEICPDAIRLFRALSVDITGLEVLDVRNVPFCCGLSFADDLLHGFVTTLERNGASLRELAVPVSELCATAIEMVTLKKLDVVELEAKNWPRSFAETSGGTNATAFPRMFQAFSGHADRSKNLSTLRELRLKKLNGVPGVNISESECTLDFFHAIRRLQVHLRLGASYGKGSIPCFGKGSITRFMNLFRNVEELDWKGSVTENILMFIFGTFRKRPALHLRFDPCEYSDRPYLTRTSTLLESLTASQGKIKTLVLDRKLSLDQMGELGSNIPALENLELQIARDNVQGLVLLIGNNCRQMRRLHLILTSHGRSFLGDDGWQIFTKAVRSACDKLHEVAVLVTSHPRSVENAVGSMVQSMVDVLEFLGERARTVRYQIPARIGKRSILADHVCRVLRTCAVHTKDLEHLASNFARIGRYSRRAYHEMDPFWKVLEEKERVLEALPHLHSIDLGIFDRHVRKPLMIEEED